MRESSILVWQDFTCSIELLESVDHALLLWDSYRWLCCWKLQLWSSCGDAGEISSSDWPGTQMLCLQTNNKTRWSFINFPPPASRRVIWSKLEQRSHSRDTTQVELLLQAGSMKMSPLDFQISLGHKWSQKKCFCECWVEWCYWCWKQENMISYLATASNWRQTNTSVNHRSIFIISSSLSSEHSSLTKLVLITSRSSQAL